MVVCSEISIFIIKITKLIFENQYNRPDGKRKESLVRVGGLAPQEVL